MDILISLQYDKDNGKFQAIFCLQCSTIVESVEQRSGCTKLTLIYIDHKGNYF